MKRLMAKSYNPFEHTELNTGWGLIYRLNRLLSSIDVYAREGKYAEWELALDRIFCNLMYKEPADVIEDDNGNITDIEITDKDYKVFIKIKENLSDKKRKILLARKKGVAEFHKAKFDYYMEMTRYDIWVKSFMQERKLYLKQSDFNPGRAMWGG